MGFLVFMITCVLFVLFGVRLSWSDTFPITSPLDLIPFREPTAHRHFDGSVIYRDGRPDIPPTWVRDYDAEHGSGAWERGIKESAESRAAIWVGIREIWRVPDPDGD